MALWIFILTTMTNTMGTVVPFNNTHECKAQSVYSSVDIRHIIITSAWDNQV